MDPLPTRVAYLDNASSAQMEKDVVSAMEPFFLKTFYGTEGLHFGSAGAKKFETDALDRMRRLFNCSENQRVIVTSCGTESCNQVLKGVYFNNKAAADCCESPRLQIITTQEEHPAVTKPCAFLQQQSAPVCYLPCDVNGMLSPSTLRQYISDKTALVSVSLVQYSSGVIQPVGELCKIAHEFGAKVHIDASLAPGNVPVDLGAIGAEFASFSANKFHGPKGVGFLVCPADYYLQPLIHGERQMQGLRAGTVNLPGLAGSVKALEVAIATLRCADTRVRSLRDQLEDGILSKIAEGVSVCGKSVPRSPSISLMLFKGVASTSIVEELSVKGVMCCVAPYPATGELGVRFSLSKFTTEDEIKMAINATAEIVRSIH